MKKLPIGIQTFSDIRTGDYCYADKTELIAQLTNQGKFYFLSRPRRFGKSLLIDTIAEAFLGNKKLFKGLFLENHWDWSKKHPVIRIDFAQGILQTQKQLDAALYFWLLPLLAASIRSSDRIRTASQPFVGLERLFLLLPRRQRLR